MTTAIEYPQYSEIMDRSFDTPDEVSEAVYDGIIDCNFEDVGHSVMDAPVQAVMSYADGCGLDLTEEQAIKIAVRVAWYFGAKHESDEEPGLCHWHYNEN